MTSTYRKDSKRYSLPEAIQAAISEHLYGAFNNPDNLIGNLDRWTHQRITDENLAKVMFVLESGDPSEACYGDLIREIDSEAETGIFLVNDNAKPEHLQHLIGETGVYLPRRRGAPKLQSAGAAGRQGNSRPSNHDD